MSKALSVFMMVCLCLAVFPVLSGTEAGAMVERPMQSAEARPHSFSAAHVPGQVIVKLRDGANLARGPHSRVSANRASLDSALAQVGARASSPVFLAASSLSSIYRITLDVGADVLSTVAALSADPNVEYAEPDYIARPATVTLPPNDPLYSQQWGLEKINALAAWDVVTGTPSVVIAIVDGGIDTSHPDLVGRLWTNPGEIPGNGIDDDNNGYVDDVNGWNFVSGSNDISDGNGHGTQVAGVIGAATNNAVGIAGLCWNCRLMPVKVMADSGVSNYSDIAAGVAYAANKGAKVINLSVGGYADSRALRDAIAAAVGAVVVAGAGNDNVSTLFYPAAYPNVLSVAGTTSADAKATYSNYGTWVSVSAPGEAITTTFLGGDYGPASGTSLAAPFVAGLAGLIRSLHPDWTEAMARNQILRTADGIDAANPAYADKLGAGRINAASAMQNPRPILTISSTTVNGDPLGRPTPGAGATLAVALRNDWWDATGVTGTLRTSDAFVSITSDTASFGDIASGATGVSTPSYSFTVASGAGYNHPIAFTLAVTANAGAYTTTLPLTVTTQSDVVQVGGFVTSDVTWTRDRVYEVVSNVQVDPGVTLTIQSGTQVRFRGKYILQIAGTLVADGQPDAPILFTSAVSKTYGTWGPINFAASAISATVDSDGNYISGSIVRNARIEYGNGIGVLSMLPYISNNTFISNSATYAGSWVGCCDYAVVHFNDQGGGPGGGGGEITGTFAVRHSTFIDNRGAAVAIANINGKRFEVTDNLITDQAGAGATQGNIGWYGSLIARNRLLRTHGFNILGAGNNTIIEDNIVTNSTGPGYTAGYGVDIYSGSPIIRHNLFANNGQGQSWCNGRCSVINIFSGGSPTVISNTFTGNWLDSLIYFNWGGSGIYQNNNWAGNRVNYVFYRLPLQNTQNVTATSNYWGTTDTTIIDELIFDYLDDFDPGRVYYQPVLAAPEPTAPAFLWDSSITPNPVGIQQATMVFTFSAPVDQSASLAVSFGMTAPYTSSIVSENGRWLNDRAWSATYDMTSLVPRGVHTISVSGAQNAATMVSGTVALPVPGGGMEIPASINFTFTVDYAGYINVTTPPPAPTVNACGAATADRLSARWNASDPNSAITLYRYAIGTTPGAADVVNWTDTPLTSTTRVSLTLAAGQTYYVSAKARNEGGLWSAAGTSSGVVAGSGGCPTAGFTASPMSGAAPLTVQFTDASSGNVTAHQWGFGDGSADTSLNPTHVYTASGVYTVSLNVAGPGGSDERVRGGYIVVSAGTTYSVSGRVTDGVNSIAGVSLSIGAGGSATTDASGYYTITNVASGAYTLVPSKNGYAFSPPSRAVSVPPDAANQNFVGTVNVGPAYSVAGRVVNNTAQPMLDVLVASSSGGAAYTDASGYYTLTNVLTGTYTLTPTFSGYVFSPTMRMVSVPPSATGQDFVGTQRRFVFLPIVLK